MTESREAGTILAAPASSPSISNTPPPLPVDGRWMPTWVAVILCCLLIWLGFVLWAQVSFGSYRFALQYLRGDRLQVFPAVRSIGTHRPGEVLETTVTIRNHGATPVKVVGATSECACTATKTMPVVIPPHGDSVTVPLTIRFRREPGEWRQSISYLTDSVREPTLRADLAGQIADR